MSLLPEIREELYAAAGRQTRGTERSPRRHRWRDSISTALVLAGVVVVVVGVGAVLLSVHHGPSQSSDRTAVSSPAEQPLLRILAVLRRRQTKADLPSALVRVLKRKTPFPPFWDGSPDLRGVRLAAVTPAGEEVFLVPYRPPSAAAIAAGIPHILPANRSRFAARLRARAAQGDSLAIQLMYHGRPGSSGVPVDGLVRRHGGASATAATIEQHGTATWGGFYHGHQTEVVLVVPNGVAKVTLAVPNPTGSAALTTVTGRVHNNVLSVLVPGAQEDPIQKMIWYGPTGQVLRRFGLNSAQPSTRSQCSSARHFLAGQPPHSITDVLGSLTTPAASAQRISKPFLRVLVFQGHGIYYRYARKGEVNGVRYYLIPMSNVSGPGCTSGPGVQLIANYGRGEAHRYLAISEIRRHFETGSDGNNHITITPLVVPSDVATVTANYPAENQAGHVAHQVITRHVKGNIVIFRVTGGWDPPSLTYRSATGAVLWSDHRH
jgi:hypothetical protein